MHAQKDMNTVVQNDQSVSVIKDRRKTIGGNETNMISGFENTKVVVAQDVAVQGNSSMLTGGNRNDQAVGDYIVGAGDSIRLECGESVLLMTAQGDIQLKGKSFNITVDNDGEINTGGVLGLNPESASPGVSKDNSGDKGKLQSTVTKVFSGKG